MRSVFSSFLFITFASPAAMAALPTNAETAISFFRDKYSLFPSGQASRSSLEGKLQRSEMESSFRCAWDKRQFMLRADQIIRDIQVSRFVTTQQETQLLFTDKNQKMASKNLPLNTSLEIIRTTDFWALVKTKNTSQLGWVPLHVLRTKHDDTGVFTNLIETYLRKEPQRKSAVLAKLPPQQRVLPLEFHKNFLKVQYESQVGYVDITHFVSRADFANLAYHPKHNWVTVVYRNNDMIVTNDGRSLPLNEILGYATNPQRGIMKKPEKASPPLRARVEILKHEIQIWAQSKLAGHGSIWWKKKELLFNQERDDKGTTITTEQLLKREIHSIAFEGKDSLKGLVSSEGIYRTEDGQTWTLIPQFGKKNHPVSIHPNGTWFVGPFKSRNKGIDFEPFIRWDQIAKTIENHFNHNPKVLKLTKIESLPNSRVLIQVDTGTYKIRLKSYIGDLHWDVLRN